MKFQVLSTKHIDKLLSFEEENRSWFEQHIEARPKAFYSKQGVTDHVLQLTKAFDAREAYPGVIESTGVIIGRVNLTKIEGRRVARLGYRVSQAHIGKGVASFGVYQALRGLNMLGGVATVKAFVSEPNRSSQRVLEKHGFRAMREHKDHSLVGANRLTCIEYELSLV